MKRILTLIMLIIFAYNLSGEDSGNSRDLVVYLHTGWNKEKKVSLFTISPDPGMPLASDLYNVKPLNEPLPDENDPDYYCTKKERFKNINKDSLVYNYFETQSAALNYIISKNRKLFATSYYLQQSLSQKHQTSNFKPQTILTYLCRRNELPISS